mgnify:FL=1
MMNKLTAVASNKICLSGLPIFIGLAAMYTPTFHNLANSLWQSDDQGHGPLVLMVVVFLFWQKREAFTAELPQTTKPVLGYSLFIVGLLLYILGRSQDILILDIGSLIPMLMGLILITKGTKALKQVWFPLFFIVFMIPLPGFIVDSITLPMKMGVSYVAEHILYSFGYPIARTGVILQIGQYQLLVADACAGMHTLISLEALGLLYLNLVKHNSLFRNITLAFLIIPISFAANVIRVMVLTLVTYHFGDEAGQGFVHDFAGLVLFMVALLLIITVDSVLQFGQKRWQTRGVE